MRNTKKRSFGKFRGTTQFTDQTFVSKRSLNVLENSLSVGQKETLNEYRLRLCTSTGVNHPNYDPKVERLILTYAHDPKYVEDQIRYLTHLRDVEGYLFSRNLKIYDRIQDQMKRFSLPDYTSFRWNENYQKSLEEMKEEFSKLNLTPLLYVCDDDIRDALPKMVTHSGYNWILKGDDYKLKGKNMDGVYRAYLNEENKAITEGETFNKPILIGFRTQGSGEYDDEGNQTGTCKHKLRVVSMIDLYQIIAELRFSKPIQNYLATVPYYAGGKNFDEIGLIISGYRARSSNFVTLDYSSFDQTISSWLIEDVFEVIKCAFPNLTDREERVFRSIVKDFIHKKFIISEGIVESHKGVPSGSMFTQIVDTLVNKLVITTYFKSIKEKVEMIIMGDDNTLFTNANVNLILISTYLAKNFGLIVNPDKSRFGLSLSDQVEFLSCYWRDNGRWRAPEIILSKLLFSERRRDYSPRIDYLLDEESGEEYEVETVPRPELVIWSAYLTYPLGTGKLINMAKFAADYPLGNIAWMDLIGEDYIPGALAYIRTYTMKDHKYKPKYRKISSQILKVKKKKKRRQYVSYRSKLLLAQKSKVHERLVC